MSDRRPPPGRQNQQRFGPGPMGGFRGGPPSKAKDPKKTVRKLIVYLSPHKIPFFIVTGLAMVSTIFSVIGPKLLGRVTTALVDGLLAFYMGTGLLTNFPYMMKITAWLILLYIVSAIFNFIRGLIMARLSVKVTYTLRAEISEKMHRLPINYYDTRTHGEILSRVTNDVDLISQTLNRTLTQLVTSITTIIGVLVMMISINIPMTIVALLVIPPSFFIMRVVMKRSQVFFREQQKVLGNLSGIVEETYSGHNIVRAYNAEAAVEASFRETNKQLRTCAWKAQFMSSIMEPVFTFIGNLGYVLICVLGGYLAVRRAITIGDVQAFVQYIRTFMQPMRELGAVMNTMQSTIAAAERVFEFLDEEEETSDSLAGKSEILIRKHCEGRVSFQHVRFGYNPEKIVLRDFSAEIEAGQTVAIVGPTGAGKTTVVKLLMRFYELNGGKILIDGISSTEFTRGGLRDIFGMVLQDTWLYNATIMENIRYGTPDATDDEVIEAAKTAHCDEFIRALPGGYHMVLNEEATNISQGQKQLFTIARVVLKNPAVLILDEATSSVDTRTEILIQKAMKNIMKGRTSFVIAHRLSTIRDADLIFVMKEGNIVEHGTHHQLIEAKGFYADLYNSQFSEGVIAEELVS